MRKIILLVDDSITNLEMGKSILQDFYSIITSPSGEKALSLLERINPDLILLDINMPGMNGYEVIERIKTNTATCGIPVVFLTGKNSSESELEGLSMGAVDYITKPFSPPLLLKRIEMHLLMEEQKKQLWDYNNNLQKMVDEKTKRVLKLQDAILSTIADLVEFRDDTTGSHTERSRFYLKIMIEGASNSDIYRRESEDWDIKLLIQSAQLHDVGKICIPDSILKKPGKLTAEEFEDMKRHTTLGKEAIERISEKMGENEFLHQAAVMAYSHHERWDGKGYPLGLKGNEIPLQGRFMAIADVYDALISKRPYKQPYTHEEARNIIFEGGGTQFDPNLVKIFKESADDFETISGVVI